jgi:hypothetical protein
VFYNFIECDRHGDECLQEYRTPEGVGRGGDLFLRALI